MAQFYEGLPYSRFGLASSMLAFLLCFFGARWLKVWTIAPLLLFVWWAMIGMASL
jgi:hypothetical protein